MRDTPSAAGAAVLPVSVSAFGSLCVLPYFCIVAVRVRACFGWLFDICSAGRCLLGQLPRHALRGTGCSFERQRSRTADSATVRVTTAHRSQQLSTHGHRATTQLMPWAAWARARLERRHLWLVRHVTSQEQHTAATGRRGAAALVQRQPRGLSGRRAQQAIRLPARRAPSPQAPTESRTIRQATRRCPRRPCSPPEQRLACALAWTCPRREALSWNPHRLSLTPR